MPLHDIFSKRQKKLRGEVPDVYLYDEVPSALRVQVVHIIKDMLTLPAHHDDEPSRAYRYIVEALCREYGMFKLHGESQQRRDYVNELFNFFLEVQNVERALDVVEFTAKYADRLTRTWDYLRRDGFDARVDRALDELNARFREHGVGFQYEAGELIQVDSDLLHSEAVKPALGLLRTRGFAGPRDEFLEAYSHYRHGNFEVALTEALKAFESTMKSICDARKWRYESNATAKTLVNVCLANGLVDEFWQSHFSGLRANLESSIATARNKLGGHGQGAAPREVPRALVAYVLHMTASTIVFLIESSGLQSNAGAS